MRLSTSSWPSASSSRATPGPTTDIWIAVDTSVAEAEGGSCCDSATAAKSGADSLRTASSTCVGGTGGRSSCSRRCCRLRTYFLASSPHFGLCGSNSAMHATSVALIVITGDDVLVCVVAVATACRQLTKRCRTKPCRGPQRANQRPRRPCIATRSRILHSGHTSAELGTVQKRGVAAVWPGCHKRSVRIRGDLVVVHVHQSLAVHQRESQSVPVGTRLSLSRRRDSPCHSDILVSGSPTSQANLQSPS